MSIDNEGFRSNIGIILTNSHQQVLWAHRIKQGGWQFPQGGMLANETPEETLYRELYEELGLHSADVCILGHTQNWLRYRLPEQFIRRHIQPVCIGQKQKWFLLHLVNPHAEIQLAITSTPEFDQWRWVNYWHPLKEVIAFKRDVYRQALQELEPLLKKEPIKI